MKYLALAIVILGAAIAYPAKKWVTLLRRREPTDKETTVVKIIGLVLVLIGVICVFYFGR